MELTYEDLWLNWTPRLPAWGVGFPGLHVGPVSVSIGCDLTYRVAYWWPDLSHEERCAIWTQIWPVFRTSIEQQLGIRVLRCECGCGMVQFLSLAQFQQASFVGSAGGGGLVLCVETQAEAEAEAAAEAEAEVMEVTRRRRSCERNARGRARCGAARLRRTERAWGSAKIR